MWQFASYCPPEDLYGLYSQASDEIAHDTDDHFQISFILPRKAMNELWDFRILGLAIGRPLDLSA